ncbi:hypothetical protein QP343_01095 [Lactobacillus jensenii]|jgi:hypothetical protein|uniref:Uncharacterized protein n=1 Tax=Lactobacillus jensenii TaxID=109790 RepID=A0A5N1ID97_LACJE|nr:hypothetical protein [Lactobacillus jensenii]EEQ68807.1 hypothetical protein LBJG_01235 [Lactobacillus jensenii 1153]APT14510.1 hypothetical protein BUE77_03445 [Lactobacillus jensenii]EEQ24932.1 hypothetical protein LACJE0001_0802 [Lactobacillus jensenii 269-3]EEX27977.1 hypothetical protein HMPREF0527_00212 [Lactobacillus jensenii SJ-7A-US]KAA9237067.1 hypothetical protein F6I36_00670 [Lactobacillus jensenii]
MKKITYLVTKIVVSLAFAFSLLLLLTSSINMKSNNNRLYAKQLITNVANDAGFGNLSSLFASSGLEDEMLSHLPKKSEVSITPLEVYNLSSTYKKQGKFSSKDLKLPSKTSGEKFISKYITVGINAGLKRNNEDVKNALNLYQLVYYALLLCFAISIILVLLGKRFAGITAVLSSAGMLVGLLFASEKATTILDEILYSGMKVTISPNFLTAVIVVVIASIVWEVVCHNYRKTQR